MGKARVTVTIDVPSDIHMAELLNSPGFQKLAGQAVASVAAQMAGAEIDPKWNDDGFHVTSHVHVSTRDSYCDDCVVNAKDRIN